MRPTQQGAAAHPGNAGVRACRVAGAARWSCEAPSGSERRFAAQPATPSVCLGGMKKRKGEALSQSGGESAARRRAWAVCRPIGRRRQSALDRQRHKGSPVPGSMAICALRAETRSEGLLVGFEAPREVGARRAFQAGRSQSIKKSRQAGFFYAVYSLRPLSQRQIGGPREWKPRAFFFLFGAPSGAPIHQGRAPGPIQPIANQ